MGEKLKFDFLPDGHHFAFSVPKRLNFFTSIFWAIMNVSSGVKWLKLVAEV
jgi:hypothetical protein